MELSLILLAVFVAIVFYFSVSRKRSATNEARDETDFEENDAYRDSWEGGFWEASDPKRVMSRLQIDYQDWDGSSTTRSVKVREFDEKLYGGIILGHCDLRDATRTFRIDRMKSCIDTATGKEVRDVRQHLLELYERSPRRTADLLVSDYIDVLKVLYFLEIANGQYGEEENRSIAAYLNKLLRDNGITSDTIDHALRDIPVPSFETYKLALGKVLIGGQVNPELLRTCCYEIVKKQTTTHAVEKKALKYLDRKLTSLHASKAYSDSLIARRSDL